MRYLRIWTEMNSNGSRFIWMCIRDFLNTAIQSNRFLEASGACWSRSGEEFQDFDALAKGESFDYLDPNFDVLSKYAYVRYGDVMLNYEIAQGDGNHVGTYDQAVTRIVSAFAIAQNVWPTLTVWRHPGMIAISARTPMKARL